MSAERPRFPIALRFLESGEVDHPISESDLASDLESFSDEDMKRVLATDATGRRVRFRTHACKVEMLEYVGIPADRSGTGRRFTDERPQKS